VVLFDPLAESEFQVCPVCRRVIDPAAIDTVLAIELVRFDTPRGRKYVDGLEVVFHESCFPATSPRYRRVSVV
jgi:hypothetical protein